MMSCFCACQQFEGVDMPKTPGSAELKGSYIKVVSPFQVPFVQQVQCEVAGAASTVSASLKQDELHLGDDVQILSPASSSKSMASCEDDNDRTSTSCSLFYMPLPPLPWPEAGNVESVESRTPPAAVGKSPPAQKTRALHGTSTGRTAENNLRKSVEHVSPTVKTESAVRLSKNSGTSRKNKSATPVGVPFLLIPEPITPRGSQLKPSSSAISTTSQINVQPCFPTVAVRSKVRTSLADFRSNSTGGISARNTSVTSYAQRSTASFTAKTPPSTLHSHQQNGTHLVRNASSPHTTPSKRMRALQYWQGVVASGSHPNTPNKTVHSPSRAGVQSTSSSCKSMPNTPRSLTLTLNAQHDDSDDCPSPKPSEVKALDRALQATQAAGNKPDAAISWWAAGLLMGAGLKQPSQQTQQLLGLAKPVLGQVHGLSLSTPTVLPYLDMVTTAAEQDDVSMQESAAAVHGTQSDSKLQKLPVPVPDNLPARPSADYSIPAAQQQQQENESLDHEAEYTRKDSDHTPRWHRSNSDQGIAKSQLSSPRTTRHTHLPSGLMQSSTASTPPVATETTPLPAHVHDSAAMQAAHAWGSGVLCTPHNANNNTMDRQYSTPDDDIPVPASLLLSSNICDAGVSHSMESNIQSLPGLCASWLASNETVQSCPDSEVTDNLTSLIMIEQMDETSLCQLASPRAVSVSGTQDNLQVLLNQQTCEQRPSEAGSQKQLPGMQDARWAHSRGELPASLQDTSELQQQCKAVVEVVISTAEQCPAIASNDATVMSHNMLETKRQEKNGDDDHDCEVMNTDEHSSLRVQNAPEVFSEATMLSAEEAFTTDTAMQRLQSRTEVSTQRLKLLVGRLQGLDSRLVQVEHGDEQHMSNEVVSFSEDAKSSAQTVVQGTDSAAAAIPCTDAAEEQVAETTVDTQYSCVIVTQPGNTGVQAVRISSSSVTADASTQRLPHCSRDNAAGAEASVVNIVEALALEPAVPSVDVATSVSEEQLANSQQASCVDALSAALHGVVTADQEIQAHEQHTDSDMQPTSSVMPMSAATPTFVIFNDLRVKADVLLEETADTNFSVLEAGEALNGFAHSAVTEDVHGSAATMACVHSTSPTSEPILDRDAVMPEADRRTVSSSKYTDGGNHVQQQVDEVSVADEPQLAVGNAVVETGQSDASVLAPSLASAVVLQSFIETGMLPRQTSSTAAGTSATQQSKIQNTTTTTPPCSSYTSLVSMWSSMWYLGKPAGLQKKE